ncbi:MAG: dihydrodipicolinate synthase family protein [Bacteroidota bacterium]
MFLPTGVFTATLTPLHADLSVNMDALIRHCSWLLNNGSDGLAILGTTGEANSFSLTERLQMMEGIAQSDLPLHRIMVGTGCCALPDTIALTTRAVRLGYGGVLLLPPFYYKSLTDPGMLAYFDQVIGAVNDDRLRIYLYHIPQMTGVSFSVALVKKLVQRYPGIVVGMKDSSGDFENMKQMCEVPGFQLFAGTEKFLLDVLKIGGVGCISATANATSPLAGKVFASWKAGQAAERLQEDLIAARQAFEGFVFVSALKSYFAHAKENQNWLHVRPPNSVLTSDQLTDLLRRIDQLPVALALHPDI